MAAPSNKLLAFGGDYGTRERRRARRHRPSGPRPGAERADRRRVADRARRAGSDRAAHARKRARALPDVSSGAAGRIVRLPLVARDRIVRVLISSEIYELNPVVSLVNVPFNQHRLLLGAHDQSVIPRRVGELRQAMPYSDGLSRGIDQVDRLLLVSQDVGAVALDRLRWLTRLRLERLRAVHSWVRGLPRGHASRHDYRDRKTARDCPIPPLRGCPVSGRNWWTIHRDRSLLFLVPIHAIARISVKIRDRADIVGKAYSRYVRFSGRKDQADQWKGVERRRCADSRGHAASARE